MERPLTEVRHWRRAAGRLVSVPVAEQGTVTGRVLRADERGVLLDLAGGKREFGYHQLGKGSMQVEFNRPGRGEEP